MLRMLLFILLVLVAATPAAAQTPSAPAAAEPTVVEVREEGLVARLFVPQGLKGRTAAVITLGGSEGGIGGADRMARRLAAQGYVAFAVSYFGEAGQPKDLVELPLETFDRALDWLLARPEVDRARIGVIGGSKGAEAALLFASRRPEIRAVVAGVPTHVVWQGILPSDFSLVKGSWTVGGKPIPFVPYKPGPWTGRIRDLYDRSMPAPGTEGEALIPVERIRGDVMLVSGGQDALWSSSLMSLRIAQRLEASGFRFRVERLDYPDAGHGVLGGPVTAEQAAQLARFGGTAEANMAARADAWPKILAFLDRSLRH